MSGIFNIGLSALHAAQQGLNTTGHNIANVHTEGYSRQRVELETRPPQLLGNGYVGQGVNLDNIRRIADDFLVGELRNAIGNEAGANKLTELLNIVDQQVGDARINDRMQGFFESINDANDDPRLMATRQVMLENARSMLARFSEQEQELNRLARNTDQQIATKVQEINALTQAIADINEQISRGAGLARGVPANDLLDQRDQLVATLSTKVAVQVQPRDDNTINVLIGDSQLVVAGAVQAGLTTSANALDASRLEIAFDAGGGANQVTAAINGGEIGALLDFRDGTLEPTRNAIGRLAASLAMTVNARHREGMDLSGNLGGDLFSVPAPQFTSLATNAGSISLAFDETSVGDLTTSDYRMTYDGSDFILTRLTDGSTQTLSGAGPFDVDGMTITLTSAPAVGDEYLLQPTKFVPRGLALAVSDPAELALALPVRTAAELGNTSDATIGGAEVLDATDAALLNPVQLVFNDPPTTYQVNGAGPLIPYSSGADIDINGWRVQITGAPAPGDVFTIESNVGGFGDNRNGLALAGLQLEPLMAGGTATFQEAYGILTGEVGAATNRARVSADAFGILRTNAQNARDELSGVNLDEEAANLLKFQQFYQAAAQVIAAADAIFQSLLDAT